MTNSTPAIQLTGLTKRYGALTAVDNLDLTVPAGQILAFHAAGVTDIEVSAPSLEDAFLSLVA